MVLLDHYVFPIATQQFLRQVEFAIEDPRHEEPNVQDSPCIRNRDQDGLES